MGFRKKVRNLDVSRKIKRKYKHKINKYFNSSLQAKSNNTASFFQISGSTTELTV